MAVAVMLLSSLFTALGASAARSSVPGPVDSDAVDASRISVLQPHAVAGVTVRATVDGDVSSLSALLCPPAARCTADVSAAPAPASASAEIGASMYDVSVDMPTTHREQQLMWPPHRSARGRSSSALRVSLDCFDLPASPCPFLPQPRFSRHSAALCGLSDAVHSSAWSGLWQWSSVDGSLHLHQHVPAGWPSARLAPRAVRPLSGWADFHKGSTQRAMHSTQGGERQQGQQHESVKQSQAPRAAALHAGAVHDARRLFPFDAASGASDPAGELLSVAPVIAVAVESISAASDAAATLDGAAQSTHTEHQATAAAAAAPYRVQTTQRNESNQHPAPKQISEVPDTEESEVVSDGSSTRCVWRSILVRRHTGAAEWRVDVEPYLTNRCMPPTCACVCIQHPPVLVPSLLAPPDLAETALLLEWETQWRRAAVESNATPTTTVNGDQRERTGRGGLPTSDIAEHVAGRRSFTTEGQRCTHSSSRHSSDQLAPDSSSSLRADPVSRLPVRIIVRVPDDELDRLLTADEWAEKGRRNGSHGQ